MNPLYSPHSSHTMTEEADSLDGINLGSLCDEVPQNGARAQTPPQYRDPTNAQVVAWLRLTGGNPRSSTLLGETLTLLLPSSYRAQSLVHEYAWALTPTQAKEVQGELNDATPLLQGRFQRKPGKLAHDQANLAVLPECL